MKQRLTALLLLVGVVGLVAFDRAQPNVVRHGASISAEHHTLELPPTIEATPFVLSRTAVAIVVPAPAPLVDTLRSAPLYLRNRCLLL